MCCWNTPEQVPCPAQAGRLVFVVNLAAGIRVIEGAYHIQNENACDSRLQQKMVRFHGGAAKYLANYLSWTILGVIWAKYRACHAPECRLGARITFNN